MTVLSTVIPAYSEEDGIWEIASRVLSIEPALNKVGVDRLELPVVDDGLKDRAAEVAESIPGLCVVRHSNENTGGAKPARNSHQAGYRIR